MLFSLSLFILGCCALGESHDQVADRTGLDRDLFVTLTADVGDTELGLFVVYINERALNSKITKNPTLRQTLLGYVGRNALYVNPTAEEVVDSFPFRATQLQIEQSGAPPFVPGPEDWEEVTPGFLAGRFRANPGGASYGSGSEGILVLGERIDPGRPFSVSYAGRTATFSLVSARIDATDMTPSGTPLPRATTDVPALEDVTALESILAGDAFDDAEQVAASLGLATSRVGTLRVSRDGGELRLLLILLDEAVRESALAPDLVVRLEDVIGTGAVMVWAWSPAGSLFNPYDLWVHQGGTAYWFFSSASFVDLTLDFSRVNRVLAAGEVAAGVVLLHRGITLDGAFTLYYLTRENAVTFIP